MFEQKSSPGALIAAPIADVGLLLEGTYPYVSGGVSSWVHQIINGFPDLTLWFADLRGQSDPTWQDLGTRFILVSTQPVPQVEEGPSSRWLDSPF